MRGGCEGLGSQGLRLGGMLERASTVTGDHARVNSATLVMRPFRVHSQNPHFVSYKTKVNSDF